MWWNEGDCRPQETRARKPPGDTSDRALSDDDELRRRAEAALHLAPTDSERAADEARRLLADPGPVSEVAVVAAHALGRALHELGDVGEACRVLAAAADDAARLGLGEREGHIRNSLGLSLYTSGDHAGADRELDVAEALVTGAERARVVMQRAIIDVHRGRLADGLGRFDAALGPLESAGDRVAAARLLVSRGVAQSLLGDLDEAERDFLDGRQRALGLQQRALAASAEANVAFVLGRRGDVPGALEWFDRARTSYATTGEPGRYLAILDCDLCEVLLLAGLWKEAAEAAHRAIDASHLGDNVVQEAEAQLLLARSLLAGHDAAGSLAAARSARRLFERADRPTWALQARYLEVLASSATAPSPTMIAEVREIADDLDDAGWSLEATRARTLAGRLSVELGDIAAARTQLATAARARNRGTAAEGASAWHATALLRLADGDRRGARRAVSAGLDVVERHRSTLGATELRAGAAVHGVELARLGIELALDDHRPREVLERVDRARGMTYRFPPAKPPRDGDLARHLADLRHNDAAARAARLAGEPSESLERRQVALERTIQQHARLARGDDPALGRLDVADLRARLGRRRLIEYFEVGGSLHAVVVDRRRTVVVELASTDEVASELDAALFALRRLITGVTAPVAEAMTTTLQHATSRLDALLLSPVLRSPAAELVVVPSPLVRSVPWSALPSARPITLAPSAATWLRPARPLPRRPRAAVVAGPDLPAASAEARAIEALYPRSRLLEGPAATSGAALAAAGESDVLHVAAHGVFRADSPLFSSLRLADGAVTLYDLERLPHVPHTVVLSACDAAATGVPFGDEVVGTAMTLIGIGVQAVIAPLLPVADDGVADLMVDVHRALRNGLRAAHALAGATDRRRGRPGGLDAAAFVCVGTDAGH